MGTGESRLRRCSPRARGRCREGSDYSDGGGARVCADEVQWGCGERGGYGREARTAAESAAVAKRAERKMWRNIVVGGSGGWFVGRLLAVVVGGVDLYISDWGC